MTTVLDAFVVNIGLNPKDFVSGTVTVGKETRRFTASTIERYREMEREIKKELKEIEKEQKEAARAAEAANKRIAAAHDAASETVSRLFRNVLKLAALFTAGAGVASFVSQITSADAAMGRLSKSIGSTPDAISAMANAVARNGGDANAAAGSFQRLSDSINEIGTTGNSSLLPWFARLQGLGGKQISLNKDLNETFLDMAENAKNIATTSGDSKAVYLLKQMGLSQEQALLFIKGREEVQKELAKSNRLGIVQKSDAEAAQRLQTSIETLRQTSENFGRTILTKITPAIVDLIERFQKWIEANKDWIQSDIVAKLEEFAKTLRELPWDEVGKGIRDFIKGANDGAQAVGGWKVVAEAFFALWAASKVAAVIAQIGLIRAALVTGNTSLLAAMLRVGLPVAIGAVALQGGASQTAEQYAEAKRTDPETKRFDDDRIGQRDRVRGTIGRGWNAVKRFFGGGTADAHEGGAGIRTRAGRSARHREQSIDGAVAAGGVGVGRGATTAEGKENVDSWLSFFQRDKDKGGMGLPQGKAEAMVAMMQGESGANLNPRSYNPNDVNGPSGGTAQWHDKFGRHERFSKLKDFASQMGKPWTDREAQQAFWKHEAEGSHKAVFGRIERAPTDERALGEGVAGFEVPRDVAGETRKRLANLNRLRRDRDIATIQAATRKPDVLADPKDERRKPVAEPAVPPAAAKPEASLWKGYPQAGAFVGSAQQAAQMTTENRSWADNRQTNTSTAETHFHGDMNFHGRYENGQAMAADLRESLKGRSFAQAANTGSA